MFAVVSEMLIELRFGGFGEILRLSGCRVVDEGVAVADVDAPFLVARGVACRGRGQFRFGVRKLAQTAAIAAGDVGVEVLDWRVTGLLPLEVEALAVAGPADLRGLVAVESGAAHDVVDGQGEFAGRRGLDREVRPRKNLVFSHTRSYLPACTSV